VTDAPGPWALAYIDRLQRCAVSLGRELGPIPESHLLARVDEGDAELVERGLTSGLLRIEGNYVWTQDPYQATAWLVEGNPARPCWEYLPHLAAYVELIEDHHYPVNAVRFETPEAELNLDIAVLTPDGTVLILGEVKREADQLEAIMGHLTTIDGDPGKPQPTTRGGPTGPLREAWKLAHQLWQTEAPWLWLVASGTRKAYAVRHGDKLVLHPSELPTRETLWPLGVQDGDLPRLALPAFLPAPANPTDVDKSPLPTPLSDDKNPLFRTATGGRLHIEGCPHILGCELIRATAEDLETMSACGWCQAEIDGVGRTYFDTLEDAFRDFGSYSDTWDLIRGHVSTVQYDSIWVPNSRSYIALGREGKGVAWIGKTYVAIAGGTFHELPGFTPTDHSGPSTKEWESNEICPKCHMAMPLTGICPDCD